MKRIQRKLPHPMTEQDKTFMRNLLAGVRAKYESATGKPTRYDSKEKPHEH